jgi:hypothetical protein
MGYLSRIWFAMRTRNVTDDGTDNRIKLIIKENGVEKLNHIFPDTKQEDQEEGYANVYHVDGIAGLAIRSEDLTNDSIQVSIEGKDYWRPEHVLFWGEEVDGRVVPLAAEWDIAKGISKDPSEGDSSFKVRRIIYPIKTVTQLPDKQARIMQLLVILKTADSTYAETDRNVSIEITYGGGRQLNSIDIKTLRMNKLDRGEGFLSLPLSWFPQINPPLLQWDNLESVTLRIDGDEAWLPESFSLFGFVKPYVDPHPDSSPQDPRPTSIMPLVHIPKWNFGRLSTDPDEGVKSVRLPLLPLPSFQVGPVESAVGD